VRSTDVPSDFYPNEAVSAAAENLSIAQWLTDEQARQQHLCVSWYESITNVSSPAGAFGVLNRPSQESHGRDYFMYQNHVGQQSYSRMVLLKWKEPQS